MSSRTVCRAAGDGTYLVVSRRCSTTVAGDRLWQGFRIVNHTYGAVVPQPAEYVENAPKDMVTALPDQVTRIKATFDKPGRYVWHCHILSHEDHEMMRVMHVGPGRLALYRDRGGPVYRATHFRDCNDL